MTTSTIILLAGAALVVLLLVVLALRNRKSAQEEGHGIGSEAAAAVEDVVGELLGIDAHHDHALDGQARVPVPHSPTGHPSTIQLDPADTAPPVAIAPAPAPTRSVIADATAPETLLATEADLTPDDLTRLKGLGPKAATVLATLGITRYAQLAALDAAGIARVDEALGSFKGRITRDRWIEQARFLAAGDTAGFEAQFGKLG